MRCLSPLKASYDTHNYIQGGHFANEFCSAIMVSSSPKLSYQILHSLPPASMDQTYLLEMLLEAFSWLWIKGNCSDQK